MDPRLITCGHMKCSESRKLCKCIYLHLLPLLRNVTFSLGPIFFFALITTILGSCWNSAVGLATVEELSQRVEVTMLKVPYLMKLQTCAL